MEQTLWLPSNLGITSRICIIGSNTLELFIAAYVRGNGCTYRIISGCEARSPCLSMVITNSAAL